MKKQEKIEPFKVNDEVLPTVQEKKKEVKIVENQNPKQKLNATAIEERESDPLHQSMVESVKEDKDKHNKTFNNGSKD